MPGCGQRWKTVIAVAMSATRRFSTAAHSPWKTLRVSHIPTAPTAVCSIFQIKNERTQALVCLTSVQAHSSMRICSVPPQKYQEREQSGPKGKRLAYNKPTWNRRVLARRPCV
jgi:hypothetical protein